MSPAAVDMQLWLRSRCVSDTGLLVLVLVLVLALALLVVVDVLLAQAAAWAWFGVDAALACVTSSGYEIARRRRLTPAS
jgi:hypothetical protein